MKRTLLIVVGLLVGALLLPGCSSEGPSEAGVAEIQKEMKKQTPQDLQPLTAAEASAGMESAGKTGR